MKPFEHGGNVYDAGDCNEELLDFSANINPLGLSEQVKKAIMNNMENLVHYPDPSGAKLKQVISVYYGTHPENIILGNGAVELLYIYFHSQRPQRVLIPVPSFSEYERAARAADCQIEYMYMDKASDFVLDKKKLLELLPDFDAVILGNPNNPTGKLISRADVLELVEGAKKTGSTVIMDESFLDFLTDSDRYTVIDQAANYKNLFVIQSMTKFFAIPGLRLGFAVADPALVTVLEQGKDPWNVNLLAQVAGVAALGDEYYQKAARRIVADCRDSLYRRLSEEKMLIVYEPTVNFILVSLANTGLRSGVFVKAMRDKGILVRDCSNYPGLDDYHVRFAVRLKEENDQLLKTVRQVLAENRG